MSVKVLTDHRRLLGKARDQGPRPTCLIFACSDAHAAVIGASEPLSAEFLFFHAQRRANRKPDDSSTLSATRAALLDDGQPFESFWPYLSTSPSDPGAWLPPRTAPEDIYKIPSKSSPPAFQSILDSIDLGIPVVVLFTMSDAFYRPVAGVIDHAPHEPLTDVRSHAVLVVGHGLIGAHRALLIRNSWGAAWGLDGHAWVTERYIAPRMKHSAIVKQGGQ
jgi:hypothetical protein